MAYYTIRLTPPVHGPFQADKVGTDLLIQFQLQYLKQSGAVVSEQGPELTRGIADAIDQMEKNSRQRPIFDADKVYAFRQTGLFPHLRKQERNPLWTASDWEQWEESIREYRRRVIQIYGTPRPKTF